MHHELDFLFIAALLTAAGFLLAAAAEMLIVKISANVFPRWDFYRLGTNTGVISFLLLLAYVYLFLLIR